MSTGRRVASWGPLDAMMRSPLGAHLAGLLAAAGTPLALDDLVRLAGRPRVARTLPDASVRGIRVIDDRYEIDGPDALGRIVRNLHIGPLAPGKELSARTQARALAPFRAALLTAAASARTTGEWDRAAPILVSAAFVRTMYDRGDEREALVALLSDPGRARLLAADDPAEPGRQRREAAAQLARTARRPGDLVPIAALLVAGERREEPPGAVPRRLPPVFALLGDRDRAVLLAEQVRTESEIELAYVAQALAQTGDANAADLAQRAAAGLNGAGTGALLRTAQAVAGCALHAPTAPDAHRLAQLARVLVRRAAATPQVHATVAGLRQQLFRSARDHERGVGATAVATAAAALARVGDVDAAVQAGADARALCDAIETAALRSVAAAAVAARLRVVASAALEPIADAAADRALADADGAAQLTRVARLLSGRIELDGDWTDAPVVPDHDRAEAAAVRLLRAIDPGDSAADGSVMRGALPAAVVALPVGDARPRVAARAVVNAARSTRYPSSLERRTRARIEAAVVAEAAVVLTAGDAAVAALLALDACGRVPAAARARPLADVVVALLPVRDPEMSTVAARAWAAMTGPGVLWDAAATTAVAAAAAATAREAGPSRAAMLGAMREEAELLLRRHADAASLTMLADRAARSGEPARARDLADAALHAAGAADPLRRQLAASAVAGVAMPDAAPPDIAAIARQWLADGVPAAGLPALAAHEPETAARITALLRALAD